MADKKYTITVIVDEEQLRNNIDDQETSAEGLIMQECGWMNESGIVTEKVEEIKGE